ncbi:hypothetical protein AAP_00516 [Ascosphaera apis ARSEF 7405]|uniref:Uncharacterized protein n=1 Tax=Ascosphaera apis ARSEF 7405 TaxID=392613 RepID=A0A168DZ13_9EURO|nr:hypothetical protein AAP_00516 [Ascosphaera apis ARSEF 7405]
MKFGFAVITAILASTCSAAPAKAVRQLGAPDPSSVGLNLNPLGDIVHDLTNIINVPLDGLSHPLGDLLKQSGVSGNGDTLLSGIQASNPIKKFTCDLSLNLLRIIHLSSEDSLLSFIPLPEFNTGLKLGHLANSSIACHNA